MNQSIQSINQSINTGRQGEEEVKLELSDDEKTIETNIKSIWMSILKVTSIRGETDLFAAGAGSMDVTRLVEEVQ